MVSSELSLSPSSFLIQPIQSQNLGRKNLPWKYLYLFNIYNEVFSTLATTSSSQIKHCNSNKFHFDSILPTSLFPVNTNYSLYPAANFSQGFPDGCRATSPLMAPAAPQPLTAPRVSSHPAGREQGFLWDFSSTHCLCPRRSCCGPQVSSSREVPLSNLNVQFNMGGEISACQELLRAGEQQA